MRLIDIDNAGLAFARTRGHSPGLDRAVAAYSRAGEHAAVLARARAGGCGWRQRRGPTAGAPGSAACGIVAGSYGLNQAIKFAVRRRRPDLDGLPPLTPVVTRLSFPSAHATTSFAAARAYRAPRAVMVAVPRRRRVRGQPPVSRGALPERRGRRCAARHRGGGAVAGRGAGGGLRRRVSGRNPLRWGGPFRARPTRASRPLLLGPQQPVVSECLWHPQPRSPRRGV